MNGRAGPAQAIRIVVTGLDYIGPVGAQPCDPLRAGPWSCQDSNRGPEGHQISQDPSAEIAGGTDQKDGASGGGVAVRVHSSRHVLRKKAGRLKTINGGGSEAGPVHVPYRPNVRFRHGGRGRHNKSGDGGYS